MLKVLKVSYKDIKVASTDFGLFLANLKGSSPNIALILNQFKQFN